MIQTETPQALLSKLRKLLALTTSPVEGEAQAAAFKLKEMLTKFNLDVASLEQEGQQTPGISDASFDLGKAAFSWKLDLARVLAGHYFCHTLPGWRTASKNPIFIGRPENVEALQMLYSWIMDQIRRLASEARVAHLAATGEQIHPLRWQLNFGNGAVSRLNTRLDDLRAAADPGTQALVLHHDSEISDWLEAHHGYRTDGRITKQAQEWQAQREAAAKAKADLLASSPEARAAEAILQEAARKEREAREKRWERNAKRRTGRRSRGMTDFEYRQMSEAGTARQSGRDNADKINLQPFLKGGTPRKEMK